MSALTIGASPIETIRAASAAGFAAVGIRLCGRRVHDPFPAVVIGSPAAARQIRRELDDLGIRLANVNALGFYPEVTWNELAPIVECAAQVGAPTIIANVFYEGSQLIETFGRFNDAASDAGIRVALEFLPYSRIRTLEAATILIQQIGSPNIGLLIDALHLDRSGGKPSDLLPLRADQVVFAQLCDAMTQSTPLPDDELMRQARTARTELGAGQLPLNDFIDCLPEQVELEYEVIRGDLAGEAPEAKAHAARADIVRFMDARDRLRTERMRSN